MKIILPAAIVITDAAIGTLAAAKLMERGINMITCKLAGGAVAVILFCLTILIYYAGGRLCEIISSYTHTRKEAKDPQKMLEAYQLEIQNTIDEVQRNLTPVETEFFRLQDKMNLTRQRIDTLTIYAQNAISDGRDNDAKTYLSEKQSCEQKLMAMQKELDSVKKVREQLTQMLDDLEQKKTSIMSQKRNVTSAVALANAQASVSKLYDDMDSGASGIDMDRLTQLIDTMDAKYELTIQQAEEAKKVTELERKYSGSQENIERQLSEMKEALPSFNIQPHT